MEVYIIFFILFFISPIIVYFGILKPMFEDMKARKGIDNTDFHMRCYAFMLNGTCDQAVHSLSTRNATDVMDYQFDPQKMTIDFSNNTESLKYQLTFYIIDGQTHLLVSKAEMFHGRTPTIPFLINRFFMEKLDATPIDFSVFEKRISSVSGGNN